MSSTKRPRPSYATVGNGYTFQYRYADGTGANCTRSIRVARINASEWQAFDYYSDEPIPGTVDAGRDKAAFAAMDAIDQQVTNEPGSDLEDVNQARRYLAVQGIYPDAHEFRRVGASTEFGGHLVGWTFLGHRTAGSTLSGWLSTDRTYTPALEPDRDASSRALRVHDGQKRARAQFGTAVDLDVPDVTGPSPLAEGTFEASGTEPPRVQPVPAPQASVLTHQRPADQREQDETWRKGEPIEGVVVGHGANGTWGSLPKDAENEDVKAALTVLAGTEKHHMRLRLALLRDEYDEDAQATFDVNEARGAWVVPGERSGMVKIYALLGGKHTRFAHRYSHLSRTAAAIQEGVWEAEMKIYADRFREAGWAVVGSTTLCVIALNPDALLTRATETGSPNVPESTSTRGVANEAGTEIATRMRFEMLGRREAAAEESQGKARAYRTEALQDRSPSAHIQIFEAAVRLEYFRRHRDPEYLAPAEHLTGQAAAAFQARMKDGSADMWLTVSRYAVEMRSHFYSADRETAFDPRLPSESLFADEERSLTDLCFDGHGKILSAARHLDRVRRERDRAAFDWAERALGEAADAFRETLRVASQETWLVIARYCAGLHTATLAARELHRQAGS